MRIGFIGTGAMSGAIARGLRASGDHESELVFQDIRLDKAQRLAEATAGTTAPTTEDLLAQCDLVIIAVKPHAQAKVLQAVANATQHKHCPALVSIAAGRTVQTILDDLANAGAEYLPQVVRVMPNVNAEVGESMSALCYAHNVRPEIKMEAQRIFAAIGKCTELPETLFPVFSALAGASPAWFFQIIDDLSRAGVKYGLTKAQALEAVTQAMLGAARMVEVHAAQGTNPSSLIDRVCSPGGTTVAGLLAAQEAGLGTALVSAVDATVSRDKELG